MDGHGAKTQADRKYYVERLEEYRQRYDFSVYSVRASIKEIGRCLRRDASIISRLYSGYAVARDRQKEILLAKQLEE